MTEEEYNEAVKVLDAIERERVRLKEEILKYENENKCPVFTKMMDVRNFICCEAEIGARFTFEDELYEVGDYEELIREYGWESVTDGFNSASIDELEDSYGVIRKLGEKE